MEAEGTLDCSQARGVLLQAILAAKKKKKELGEGGGDHLQWFRLRRHHGQVLSLLARSLLRGLGARGSCLCAADAAWLLLGLEEQTCHEISCSCQVFFLSVSDTFQTRRLLAMLRVKGCSGLPSLSPTSAPPCHASEKAFPLPMRAVALAGPSGICLQNFIFHPYYYHRIYLVLTFDMANRARCHWPEWFGL